MRYWWLIPVVAILIFSLGLFASKESTTTDFVTGVDYNSYLSIEISPVSAAPGQHVCVDIDPSVYSYCHSSSCSDLVVVDSTGTVVPFSIGLLDGFKYSVPITITNPNSQDLTDYQVLITLDTASLISAGKMRSDCGDIRFTDTNGNLLPYWIEDGCNTSETRIWVKVPFIPANGSTTIYVHYGNPSAASRSDGKSVFLFFDDFESWNGWVKYGYGLVSQDSTRAFEGMYSAHKTTANDPNGAYKDIGMTLGRDVVLEAWIYRNPSYSGGYCDRIGLIDGSGNGYGFGYCHDSYVGLFVDKRTNYTPKHYGEVDTGKDIQGSWYLARLIVGSDGKITAEYYYNGSLEARTTITDSTYSSFSRVYIFGGYDYWVDLFRVRKYAPQEPSVSLGSEVATLCFDPDYDGSWTSKTFYLFVGSDKDFSAFHEDFDLSSIGDFNYTVGDLNAVHLYPGSAEVSLSPATDSNDWNVFISVSSDAPTGVSRVLCSVSISGSSVSTEHYEFDVKGNVILFTYPFLDNNVYTIDYNCYVLFTEPISGTYTFDASEFQSSPSSSLPSGGGVSVSGQDESSSGSQQLTQPASPVSDSSGVSSYVVIAVVLLLGVFFFLRRRHV